MNNTKDIQNVINIACKLTSACEGFNNNNKLQLLSLQFKTLYEIYKNPHINASILAYKLDLAKSNLTLTCKKLIVQNLLQSNKDSFDKRSVFYDLTEKGKQYVEEMLLKYEENFNKEFCYKNNNKELKQLLCKLCNLLHI